MAKESAAKIKRLVGRRISEVRRGQDLTQDALAAKLNVSTQWISQCENGHENPSLEALVRFANALGVKVVDLLADEPPDPSLPQRVKPKARRPRG
ncbi:MAG: helix-turn-helix transcriptional regulator [Myxococcales bacterium]|nr:helix-turn-helix transcriptional regulator [Myxococcales bacterium]